MSVLEMPATDYFLGAPVTPFIQPVLGEEKLWELENDNSYLKYLYPDICRTATEFIEDECDRLEYAGSPIFDDYPDKTLLRQLAMKILKKCNQKAPDTFPLEGEHIRDLIEILLSHEILFRRSRYRKRRRLYF